MGGGRSSAPPPAPVSAKPITAAAKSVAEEEPNTLEAEDTGVAEQKNKRKLRVPVTKASGTNVGGDGASGLQIPK